MSSGNRFKRKLPTNEPFIGPDGTLIFQHPTIPNYYENSDKPELKSNPYANIMYYPHYDPYYTGRGVPIPPGAVPPQDMKKSFNSIKREKRIKQKISSDIQTDGSPDRDVNDTVSTSKYVYPNLMKTPTK